MAAMLDNIVNAITRLPMNWDATWLVASHHVLDMSAMLRLPWQYALNILQLWASAGRTREQI